MSASARARLFLATALLLGVGIRNGIQPVIADWRLFNAAGYKSDIVTREADRYQPLVSSLPARGIVGYLEPDDWPAADAVRRFYLAQYVLTPRVVIMGTAAEFVIVVPEASVESAGSIGEASRDARLSNFALLRRFGNGVRVFRRLQ